VKVAFCSQQLGERGTEVALYDYAHFDETLLGNQSVILSSKHNSLTGFPKFVDRFPVFLMHDSREIDMTFKTRFIQTCDAMLHASRSGETFGLFPGQFSIRNKPVITWAKGADPAHLDILQGKA
jgi:hypothetical protein